MYYTPTIKAHIALIISNALYGLNFVYYGEIIGHYLTFQQLFTVRVLFTALFFIPFIISKNLYLVKFKNFRRIAFVALLMIFGKQYLMLWGMGHITPIDSSILFSFGPIITLVFAGVLQKSHFGVLKVSALVVGAFGSLLLLFFNSTPQSGATILGYILILGSTISMAVNTTLIKPVLQDMGTIKVMGWYYLFAAVIVAPVFWSDLKAIDVVALPDKVLWQLSYIIVLGTALPSFLLYYATERSTVVHTALYTYIQPFVTTLTVLLFYHQSLSTTMRVALSIIFISILMEIKVYYIDKPKNRGAKL